MKKTLITLFLLFWTSVGSAEHLRILEVQLQNESSIPSEKIRNLLTVRGGDLFDPGEVETSRAFLERWGAFSRVDITTQRQKGGVIVSVHLEERRRIRDIHISGNYPYLSRRLHRRLAVRIGDFYDESVAREQTQSLIKFYETQGFFNTKVHLSVEQEPGRKDVVLYYRIQKGDLYRLRKITIEGAYLLPRGRLLSILNPLVPYRPVRMREVLTRIVNDYRQKDYWQARARLTRIIPDPDAKKVDLELSIREGEPTAVSFRGNHRISSRSLRKAIPFLMEGDTSAAAIREGAQSIEGYYRGRGFRGVRVFGKKGEKQERHQILFEISEGIQTRVKKVDFKGNEEIHDRKLKKELATEEESLFRDGYYRPETVEGDPARLQEVYRRLGFPEARVLGKEVHLNPRGDKVTVLFFVEEGWRSKADRVEIRGNQRYPAEKLVRLLKVKGGMPVAQEILDHDRLALENYYAERGFPYASVIATRDGTGDNRTVIYEIQEGPLVTFGDVLIVGNRKTRERTILRMLSLKKGRPFNLKRLLAGESTLRRSNTFRSVSVEAIGLKEKREIIPILVQVEENYRAFVDFEASYDTDTKLTGAINLIHNNLFGTAKRSNLRLVGGQDLQKSELNFTDPRFMGRNLEVSTGAFFEAEQRPAFSAMDVGGKLTFLNRMTAKTQILTRYDLSRTFFQSVADPSELSERDHTTSKVGVSFSYDGRDSFSDPRQGLVGFAGFDLSTKLIASGFNFLAPFGSVAHFYPLHSRVTVLQFIKAEGIHVFGDDVLARDERLFLGGDYSIRGFDRDTVGPMDSQGDPVGGQLSLLHSLEIQVKIRGEIKGAGFVDSGSLTGNISELGLASLRHSAGAGLRYVTPVGHLRLDYGIKLDRIAGESFGRIHFAFGYAF